MSGEQLSNQETDVSDDVLSYEDSQTSSVFVVPDLEEQNTSYCTILDDDYGEFKQEFCQVFADTSNTKATATSPIESILTVDLSQNSDVFFKNIGENLYCYNDTTKHLKETPFCAHSIDQQSITKNKQRNEHEKYPMLTCAINDHVLHNAKNLTTDYCSNCIENMNRSSENDYSNTCYPDEGKVNETRIDKDEIPSCHSKSNETVAGQSKVDKKSNSKLNIDSKHTGSSLSKTRSKNDIENALALVEKIKCDGGCKCLLERKKSCCSTILKLPPCPSIQIKQKSLHEEQAYSCCSILQKFKESNSLSAFHRCSSQSSNNQNKSSPSVSNDTTNCEGLLRPPDIADEDKKRCKTGLNNCSNVLMDNGSEMNDEEGLSVVQLDKCPSKVILNHVRNNLQFHEESLECTDTKIPSSTNLFTDSHRNFETYYGFHNNVTKKRHVANCMKVKIVPSNTKVINSGISVIKMTVNQNETIPTCKIASENFTSMAKDFFGGIYKKTRDAVTIITSESAKLLDLVLRKSQSCNTDESLLVKKTCYDKCTDTATSHIQERSYTLTVVDQGTNKRYSGTGNKFSIEPSGSVIKRCTCNEPLRTTECAHIVGSSQANSVFTAIKSRIFSIFREDCNTALGSKSSRTSTVSEQIIVNSDSNESLTDEASLRKTT